MCVGRGPWTQRLKVASPNTGDMVAGSVIQMSEAFVTLAIKRKTQRRVSELRLVDRESYDSVLNRLIDWYHATHPTYKKDEESNEAHQ